MIGSQSIQLYIIPVNHAPTFVAASSVISVMVGSAFCSGMLMLCSCTHVAAVWARNMSAGPGEERSQNLTFVLTSARHDVFGILPSVNITTGILSFSIAETAVVGTTNVTVTLQDDGGVLNGGHNTSIPVSLAVVIGSTSNAIGPLIYITIPGGVVLLAVIFALVVKCRKDTESKDYIEEERLFVKRKSVASLPLHMELKRPSTSSVNVWIICLHN